MHTKNVYAETRLVLITIIFRMLVRLVIVIIVYSYMWTFAAFGLWRSAAKRVNGLFRHIQLQKEPPPSPAATQTATAKSTSYNMHARARALV